MKKQITILVLISFLIMAAKLRPSNGYTSKITSPYFVLNEVFRTTTPHGTNWEYNDGSGWQAMTLYDDPTLADGIGKITSSGSSGSPISVKGKIFTNSGETNNGHGLWLSGNYINVDYCLFMDGYGLGVFVDGSENVNITNSFFTNLGRGVLVNLSTGDVHVNNNQFLNMVWDRVADGCCEGQFVQFAACSGSGFEIKSNRGENFFGESFNEDLINVFNSGGTSGSHFLIKGNIFRGGSWSTSGGGVLAGDNGGQYVDFDSNFLVNPGRYSFQNAGGSNMNFTNNQVFADQLAWNAVSFYITGCSSTSIGTSNWSNYKNHAGSSFGLTGSCGGATGPSTGQTLASMNIPDTLLSYISKDQEWIFRAEKWDYTNLVTNGDTYGTEDGSSTCNVRRATANAGSDQSISISTATLSGSGTPGTGGTGTNTVVAYRWVQVSGPNAATMSASTSATNNLSGLITGEYWFRLEVTQDNGQHGYDTFHADWIKVTVSISAPAGIKMPVKIAALNFSPHDWTGYALNKRL